MSAQIFRNLGRLCFTSPMRHPYLCGDATPLAWLRGESLFLRREKDVGDLLAIVHGALD